MAWEGKMDGQTANVANRRGLMKIGGKFQSKAGLWFFIIWNLAVLGVVIVCAAKLGGVVRGKTLLTFGIIGYVFGGVGGGAWLSEYFERRVWRR
jgi:hypothetical protein